MPCVIFSLLKSLVQKWPKTDYCSFNSCAAFYLLQEQSQHWRQGWWFCSGAFIVTFVENLLTARWHLKYKMLWGRKEKKTLSAATARLYYVQSINSDGLHEFTGQTCLLCLCTLRLCFHYAWPESLPQISPDVCSVHLCYTLAPWS